MMITRCPECATAFRITQAQLDARLGQVRCGRCGEIFDASATLEMPDEVREPAAHAAQTTQRVEENAAPADETTDLVEDRTPAAEHSDDDAETTPVIAAAVPARVDEDGPVLLQAENDADGDAAPPATPPLPGNEQATLAAAGRSEPHRFAREPVPKPAYTPRETAHYFVDSPLGAPRTRSRWATRAWLLVSVLLFLALLAQGLYHFRGTLALLLPEAKPYIHTLCAELGCEVPLPRRAELVSIETSDLQANPAQPGVLLLSATLRNRAAFPQDFPALELTLTNEKDQPLARRVLQPRDYLRRAADAGFLPASEQQISLPLEAIQLKASGYRLYLFYP